MSVAMTRAKGNSRQLVTARIPLPVATSANRQIAITPAVPIHQIEQRGDDEFCFRTWDQDVRCHA